MLVCGYVCACGKAGGGGGSARRIFFSACCLWSYATTVRLLRQRGDLLTSPHRLYVDFKISIFFHCQGRRAFELAATHVGDYSGAPPSV